MALTARDWWDQHVVGPAFLWLLVGLPSGILVAAASGFLGWQIDGGAFWVRAYRESMLVCAVVVVGTSLWRRYKRRRHAPEDDRGQAAVDPFWVPLLLVCLALGLLIVQDVVGAVA